MNFEQRMQRYFEKTPVVHPSAFVAPGAVLTGDVTLGEESSVWFHTVLRADINAIKIGPRSKSPCIAIQENISNDVFEAGFF